MIVAPRLNTYMQKSGRGMSPGLPFQLCVKPGVGLTPYYIIYL